MKPIPWQKFIRFAETHHTVLNQILRQSTQPIAEGPFAVLVEAPYNATTNRILDFDVKRRYFRQVSLIPPPPQIPLAFSARHNF